MKIRGIRGALLRGLLAAAAETHPREFVGILRERDGIIEELDIVAGTISGSESASLHMDMLPLDTHRVGSAHSHPNGSLTPSRTDLDFFPSAGKLHLILGYPYDASSWRCYAADGTPLELEVIW